MRKSLIFLGRTAILSLMISIFSVNIKLSSKTDMEKIAGHVIQFDDFKYSVSPCVEVFDLIQKYSKVYDVPIRFVLRCAKVESGYRGPDQSDYNPYLISSADALGAMQVLLSTARYIWNDNTITKDKLLYDNDFNIKTAVMYMRYLYDRYNSWESVFSYYGQGFVGKSNYNSYVKKILE
jgi:hypothetical protein